MDMATERMPMPNPKGPDQYQIHIQGQLGPEWTDWFDGLSVALAEDDGVTRLTGPVADQAALHRLLKKIRDLGLNLISVNPADAGQAGGPTQFRSNESPTS